MKMKAACLIYFCILLSVSMLGWFLYFKITIIIRLETFSNRELLWGLYPGILRFSRTIEKKEFSDSAILISPENISSFSTNKICSFETILSERKGFTVFQKVLLSLTCFSFKLLYFFFVFFSRETE